MEFTLIFRVFFNNITGGDDFRRDGRAT